MQDAGFTPQVMKYVRAADPANWWGALGEAGAYACTCPGWVPGMTGGGNDEFWSAYEDEYGLDEFPETVVLTVPRRVRRDIEYFPSVSQKSGS